MPLFRLLHSFYSFHFGFTFHPASVATREANNTSFLRAGLALHSPSFAMTSYGKKVYRVVKKCGMFVCFPCAVLIDLLEGLGADMLWLPMAPVRIIAIAVACSCWAQVLCLLLRVPFTGPAAAAAAAALMNSFSQSGSFNNSNFTSLNRTLHPPALLPDPSRPLLSIHVHLEFGTFSALSVLLQALVCALSALGVIISSVSLTLAQHPYAFISVLCFAYGSIEHQ